MFEYIGIFVVGLIIGMALAVFTRTMLRVFLFFTGFYIVVTFLLWWLGLITFTISYNDVVEMIKNYISNIKLDSSIITSLDIRYVIAIIGGILGFIFGWKKI